MSLYNKKSLDCFITGFESAFDLYPKIDLPERLEAFEKNGFVLDESALRNDWKQIENDIENSRRNYDNSTENSIPEK